MNTRLHISTAKKKLEVYVEQLKNKAIDVHLYETGKCAYKFNLSDNSVLEILFSSFPSIVNVKIHNDEFDTGFVSTDKHIVAAKIVRVLKNNFSHSLDDISGVASLHKYLHESCDALRKKFHIG